MTAYATAAYVKIIRSCKGWRDLRDVQVGAPITAMIRRKAVIKISILQESFINSLDFRTNHVMLQLKTGFVLQVFWRTSGSECICGRLPQYLYANILEDNTKDKYCGN